jgi:hypothetical protein
MGGAAGSLHDPGAMARDTLEVKAFCGRSGNYFRPSDDCEPFHLHCPGSLSNYETPRHHPGDRRPTDAVISRFSLS